MMGKLAFALVAALAFAAFAQQDVAEPDGYRMDNYRAPVPATLAGAKVLTTVEAEAIWRARTGVFVDVLPRPPKPKDLPEGTVKRVLSFGYGNVAWYPEGTDGWERAKLPLTEAQPEPRSDERSRSSR
jgi:hypothetical protein